MLPDNIEKLPAELQPYGIELFMQDDVFIKQMAVPRAGTYIPQHSHPYGHTSMLAKGKIRVWQDGELRGDFSAPTGLYIPARTKHLFLTLEDDTIVYCIHNSGRPGFLAELEEHEIVEA